MSLQILKENNYFFFFRVLGRKYLQPQQLRSQQKQKRTAEQKVGFIAFASLHFVLLSLLKDN